MLVLIENYNLLLFCWIVVLDIFLILLNDRGFEIVFIILFVELYCLVILGIVGGSGFFFMVVIVFFMIMVIVFRFGDFC